MTIYEVQQENIRILEQLRIPPEEGIFRAVRGVIQNCRACMEAIERTEAEKRREAEREEAEKPETGEGQAEEIGTGETGN